MAYSDKVAKLGSKKETLAVEDNAVYIREMLPGHLAEAALSLTRMAACSGVLLPFAASQPKLECLSCGLTVPGAGILGALGILSVTIES